MTRSERRFQRQFKVPAMRGPMSRLRRGSWFPVRFPVAILLIVGGVFSFLPIFGVWMLPLGFLLLAVDLPVLRGPISALIIRSRRTGRRWLRRFRQRNSGS